VDAPVKTVDALDLKFRDWIGYLRYIKQEDVDEAEAQYKQVFTELGYTEEQLMQTTLRDCNKVVELYIEGMQEILKGMQEGFPVSIPGNYKYGKDASPELLSQAIPIHMNHHEVYKERVGRR